MLPNFPWLFFNLHSDITDASILLTPVSAQCRVNNAPNSGSYLLYSKAEWGNNPILKEQGWKASWLYCEDCIRTCKAYRSYMEPIHYTTWCLLIKVHTKPPTTKSMDLCNTTVVPENRAMDWYRSMGQLLQGHTDRIYNSHYLHFISHSFLNVLFWKISELFPPRQSMIYRWCLLWS